MTQQVDMAENFFGEVPIFSSRAKFFALSWKRLCCTIKADVKLRHYSKIKESLRGNSNYHTDSTYAYIWCCTSWGLTYAHSLVARERISMITHRKVNHSRWSEKVVHLECTRYSCVGVLARSRLFCCVDRCVFWLFGFVFMLHQRKDMQPSPQQKMIFIVWKNWQTCCANH